MEFSPMVIHIFLDEGAKELGSVFCCTFCLFSTSSFHILSHSFFHETFFPIYSFSLLAVIADGMLNISKKPNIFTNHRKK